MLARWRLGKRDTEEDERRREWEAAAVPLPPVVAPLLPWLGAVRRPFLKLRETSVVDRWFATVS